MKTTFILTLLLAAMSCWTTTANEPAPAVPSETALIEAAKNFSNDYRKSETIIRKLLKQGVNINARDEDGNNILMLLVKENEKHGEDCFEKELLQELCRDGIDLHARNKAGMTLADINACLYAPLPYVTEVLEQVGVTPCQNAQLVRAAADSNIAEVERLLALKADPNYYNAASLRKCLGVMTEGPKKNEVFIMALLLQAGADPNIGGTELMSLAVDSDYSASVVPMLLEHGYRVKDASVKDHSRWLQHLLCIRSQKQDVADLLICHGATVTDEDWYEPAIIALLRKEQKNDYWWIRWRVRHAIEQGFDVNRLDKKGKTAYEIAKEQKSEAFGIIEMTNGILLKKRQDAQKRDAEGRTPLMLAVADPNQGAIELYKWLRAGADVNARDAQGRTALFYLHSFCPQKALKARVLIDAGADVNARDKEGLTPLLALPHVYDFTTPQQHSCAPIIRLLAEAGADMQAKDKNGLNKAELILQQNTVSKADEECLLLLRQYGVESANK